MRASRPGLAALFAGLGLAGCVLQPTAEPHCDGARSCGTCLARSGCGWCGSSGECLPGSSFGADDGGRCRASSWRFTGCTEPPAATGCGTNEDCNSCLFDLDDDPDCTWCPSVGECVGRDAQCEAGIELREYDLCGEADCRAQNTCGACRAADCDWCDSAGGSCLSPTGMCDLHYEFTRFDDDARCPPPNRCSDHLSCGSCLADPDCGWCDTPGPDAFCVASDGFGDYADWCSAGSFVADGRDCP